MSVRLAYIFVASTKMGCRRSSCARLAPTKIASLSLRGEGSEGRAAARSKIEDCLKPYTV
eukprot:1010846-Prorocentrum_minimum.AAC.5